MAKMVANAFTWLADRLKESAGDEASYERGTDSIPVTVVSQGDGGNVEYMSRLADTPEETVYAIHPPEQGYCGFLVAVGDLVIGGEAVLPERGDKIIIGDQTFELSSPAGTQPWKYHPNPHYKTWFLIHTRLTASD